jgi:hypothetical protein
VTTRSLVEQALAKLIEEARQPGSFTLPDLSVPGGVTPEFADAPWEVIRDEIYPMPKIRTSDEA